MKTKSTSIWHNIGHFLSEFEQWIEMLIFTGIVVYWIIDDVIPFLTRLFHLLQNPK